MIEQYKNRLKFRSAEASRNSITKAEEKRIRQLYENASKEVRDKITKLNMESATGALQSIYLNGLEKSIKEELEAINKEIHTGLKEAMLDTANKTIEESREMLKSMGFAEVGLAFGNVPRDVVEGILTGKIYEEKWSLSERIWGMNKQQINSINEIVANGALQGKSAFDIAKDLEKYVSPSAKKPWDWNKVYPHVSKQIDYNAIRLARTLITHAYQKSFEAATIDNPFITAYRWVANGSRVCPICQDLDGTEFPKDDTPLDHPNGMCTLEAVINGSMEDIAKQIGDWYEAEEGTYPEIDEYAKKLGYDPSKWKMPPTGKPITNTQEAKGAGIKQLAPEEKIKEYFKGISDDRLEEMFLNFEGLHGDQIGKMVAESLGYSGKPILVDSLSEGGEYIARGLIGTDKQKYIEQFKTGDLFFGKGIYGNGTYAGVGESAYNTALGYANGDVNGVIQMKLPSSAKVVEFDKIAKEYEKFYNGLTSERDIYLYSDLSSYAMLKGYDAIKVTELGYINVLNRSILEVLK